jgi:hypothetical protein
LLGYALRIINRTLYLQIDMKNFFVFAFALIAIIGCSKPNHPSVTERKQSNNYALADSTHRFLKIDISDTTIKSILHQYSSRYNFDVNGIILASITTVCDTTNCILFLFLDKKFFDYWLKHKNFVLYDTIDNRLVILTTRIEPTIKLSYANAVSDTIINKYLRKSDTGDRMDEIWLVEYTIVNGITSHKVLKNYPGF